MVSLMIAGLQSTNYEIIQLVCKSVINIAMNDGIDEGVEMKSVTTKTVPNNISIIKE